MGKPGFVTSSSGSEPDGRESRSRPLRVPCPTSSRPGQDYPVCQAARRPSWTSGFSDRRATERFSLPRLPRPLGRRPSLRVAGPISSAAIALPTYRTSCGVHSQKNTHQRPRNLARGAGMIPTALTASSCDGCTCEGRSRMLTRAALVGDQVLPSEGRFDASRGAGGRPAAGWPSRGVYHLPEGRGVWAAAWPIGSQERPICSTDSRLPAKRHRWGLPSAHPVTTRRPESLREGPAHCLAHIVEKTRRGHRGDLLVQRKRLVAGVY